LKPISEAVQNSVKSKSLHEFISFYQAEAIRFLKEVSIEQVAGFIEDLELCSAEGRQVFTCGNGGSAAAASHFAADLCKMAILPGQDRFRVHSLADNLPWATAVANDVAFEAVFVERLRNLARPGDRLVAFSTSGRSHNVLRAVEWANDNGLVSWALTGANGGALAEMASRVCSIPGTHTGHLEEAHFLIFHIASYFFAETE
jgi:D-sedoheptulose 7-phosphate isomerase